MQRCEGNQSFQLAQNCVIDDNWLGEITSTVNDSVPDGDKSSVRTMLCQPIQKERYQLLMIGCGVDVLRHVHVDRGTIGANCREDGITSDTRHLAADQRSRVRTSRVDGELDTRRTGIENQYDVRHDTTCFAWWM